MKPCVVEESERFTMNTIENRVLRYIGDIHTCQICNERIKSGDILIPISCMPSDENYRLYVDAVYLVHRKCWEKRK